jgi:hypothetical protein
VFLSHPGEQYRFITGTRARWSWAPLAPEELLIFFQSALIRTAETRNLVTQFSPQYCAGTGDPWRSLGCPPAGGRRRDTTRRPSAVLSP